MNLDYISAPLKIMFSFIRLITILIIITINDESSRNTEQVITEQLIMTPFLTTVLRRNFFF